MRHVRFEAQGQVHRGVAREDGTVVDASGRTFRADGIRWLPPVEPRSVVGTVLNYADHADELGLERPKEPTLFFKPVSSLIGHGAPILYPRGVQYMHYEVELAAVIGKTCRRVHEEEALACVAGYTIANDVTVRDFVTNTFRPPIKAKGWDTFGPLGPWMVDGGDIGDPGRLGLRAYVNGELRQEGNTAELIFGVPALIAYISAFMTLSPGDVILTGTPKGLSHVYPGDVIRLEIDGIGALENPVVEEGDPS